MVVSAEEMPRGKPAPDVFLEAARRLGVPAHECAVVEDARFGVEAARRAFMRCIAVPYLHDKPLDDAFLMADLLFEDGHGRLRCRARAGVGRGAGATSSSWAVTSSRASLGPRPGRGRRDTIPI